MLNQHNTSVSRVSRDGSKAILLSEGGFYVYSKAANTISAPFKSLKPLVASGEWRRPVSGEDSVFVPMEFPTISDEEAAEILAEEEAEDVEELPTEEEIKKEDELSSDSPEKTEDEYDFNSEYDFYAVPSSENPEEVIGVYALDPDDEATLFVWQGGEFVDVSEEEFDSSDMSHWVLVDSESAVQYAQWMDSHPDGEFCSIFNDPTEKALFDSAEADIDWAFIDTLSAVVADASGYSPVERSRNAQKQRRGPGGRFARSPGETPSEPANEETRAVEVKKTYIPAKRNLVLLDNPFNFIVDFIGSASPSSGPAIGGGVGVTAAGEPEQIVGDQAQKDTREKSVPSPDAVYFAIVSKDDARAVQGLLAITKAEDGKPQAWNRNNGEWKLSPDALADLQSITPPPVVKLEEDEVEAVLQGIDKFDTENPEEDKDSPEKAAQASMMDDIRKGYALDNGTFRIKSVEDLFSAIENAPENAEFDIKAHIVKRARAFNRMDVVPEEWRSLGAISQNPLFNSYGEVIIAAGNKGGNEETLKRYWGSGKGAAKIRWGSEGDLTRCHRKLTKYLGSERAWGYCQNLHMRKYGKSNYKKDNG